MPRTIFPPTPASSVDIVGKDGGPQLSCNDKALFALPSPAMVPAPTRDVQAEENEGLQTRTGSGYSLPPPPMRTRKIIQMTPKMEPRGDIMHSSTEVKSAKTRQTAASSSPATRKATGKKQPSSTSQAGKKIARKTAHSVIERRRRSKMNEEFGVLKHMIPACRNQEMHKLAILQASIEYLRYLEQCVQDLKAANGAASKAVNQRSPPPFQRSALEYHPYGEDDNDDDEDSDVDMNEPPSLVTTYHSQSPAYTSPHSTDTSPALDALQQLKDTSYTSSLSELPSPAIEAQQLAGRRDRQRSVYSTSTSPNLRPTSSKEADEEATEVLLMLNKDRRNTNTSSNSSYGRGMSVKDLLSS
ncbi:MAG: hypothetical protein Q9170_002294 [Blastenia crenularia]